jgi:DNA polymerase eta
MLKSAANDTRYVILIDMDAYYAQVEMKMHQIPKDKPAAVIQWTTIIALSYPAKKAGVKRGMTAHEVLEVCPDCILVHVSTFAVSDELA